MIDYILNKHSDYYVAHTSTTPMVLINTNEGYVKISGRSVPENSLNFYSPLIRLAEKINPLGKEIKIIIELEYFNTSSAKCIFDLLKVLKRKASQGLKIQVYWRFEADDLDMKETGEDYEDLLQMDFIYEEIYENTLMQSQLSA